jgi:hypothetical protein
VSWVIRIAEAADWHSLELDISWSEIEARLGSALPADFKRFCEVFGRGDFCDGFVVYSTGGGESLDLLDELASLRRIAETVFPNNYESHALYVAGGSGLIPWGEVTQGHAFYWQADSGDPDKWPVVMAAESGEWLNFDMSMSEFIFRVFMDEGFDYTIAHLIDRPYYRPA